MVADQLGSRKAAVMKIEPMCRRCFGWLILATVLFCGCNGSDELELHPITGKIVYADGSPAMFGDIEFQSDSMPVNARGKIQRDGTFTLTTNGKPGAVEGQHKVVVVQVVTNHFNLDVVHNHGDLVHEKYASYSTTDLSVTVESGKNNVVLNVEKRVD